MKQNKLIFNKIPKNWEEYIPLGNGRLGTMVKTDPSLEVLQLNEEGIWSGGPQNRINPDAKKYLKQVKSFINNGQISKAQELLVQSFSGTSLNQRAYQTAGEFKIDFFENPNLGMVHTYPVLHKSDDNSLLTYKSELDLDNAILSVKYKDSNNVNYTRQTFISESYDTIFMYVKADKPSCINFNAYLDRGIWQDSIFKKDDFIFLKDTHSIPFTVGAGVVYESKKNQPITKGVNLTGYECDSVLFFIDIQTWQHPNKNITQEEYKKLCQKDSYTDKCYKKLLKIKKLIQEKGIQNAFELLKNSHIKEYQKYWSRFSLDLDNQNNLTQKEYEEQKELSLSELFDALRKDDKNSTYLINLYANFCRYLIICSSKLPGVLPSTLQGLWNCYMDPPWQSKYTININTQMNYWPVQMCNLKECHIPLFNLLERAYKNGVIVAKKMYDCRGYVLHHNTDFWGDAAPQDSWIAGTYWVLGSAWLATCIWDYFEYTQDIEFLKKYYYLLHEACVFYVDFLEESNELASDNKPYLILNPSVSPENTYITKNGESGTVCAGCQMDNMILEHLFTVCLKAKSLLNNSTFNKKHKNYVAKDFTDFEYVLSHLKKPGFNSDSSLMEWMQEYTETEKGHRHISHLYGLFPGVSIDGFLDDDYSRACKKTLETRLQNGGGHTGWSQAWIINFYASLGMKEQALKSINNLLKNSTLPNLLDNHPPFQIDGNFGALSGIIRLIIQSKIKDDGKIQIRLLPALPNQWPCGKIKGVCIKGGYTLDMQWQDGKVKDYTLYKDGKALTQEEVEKIELV